MSLHKIPSNLFRTAEKWLSGSATEKEKREFDEWYNSFDDTEADVYGEESETEMERRLQDHILNTITREERIRPKYLWYKIAMTAVVLFSLSSIFFFYLIKEPKNTVATVKQVHDPIIPGGNKAILTLANGKKISLNDISNGQIANQGGIKITKSKNGQLIYTVNAVAGTSGISSSNTIETPKGGQYQILLPDGTKVYLNAASSLTYPTSFSSATERVVSLTGEAYFEVAKDKTKPFKVFAVPLPRPSVLRNQIVEVLGTHFNINAYPDEPYVKTTLVEGSVNVNYKYKLTPNHQSVFDGKTMRIIPIDTESETAWKNGDFVFDGQDFATVTRMISRWYNVDFELGPEAKNLHFTGLVSRSKNISAVIKMMESTEEVKFRFEGRRIIMTK